MSYFPILCLDYLFSCSKIYIPNIKLLLRIKSIQQRDCISINISIASKMQLNWIFFFAELVSPNTLHLYSNFKRIQQSVNEIQFVQIHFVWHGEYTTQGETETWSSFIFLFHINGFYVALYSRVCVFFYFGSSSHLLNRLCSSSWAKRKPSSRYPL